MMKIYRLKFPNIYCIATLYKNYCMMPYFNRNNNFNSFFFQAPEKEEFDTVFSYLLIHLFYFYKLHKAFVNKFIFLNSIDVF